MNKSPHMALASVFAFVMIVSLVAQPVAATSVSPETMKSIEYHYQLNPVDSLDATGKLSTKFLACTKFIKWEKTPTYKRGFYIDTQDRYLKRHDKVLRVRFDLAKPEKSKITLKSRSRDISKVDFMGREPEGEIDSFFGIDQYSFSVDTPIPSEEYDLNTMTPKEVLTFLQAKNTDLYARTEPLRNHMKESPLIKTAVMQMATFKGVVSEGPHKGMKVELQIWTAGDTAYPVLAEIGFDGKVADRKYLDLQDTWLSGRLKADNLLAEDAGASKTALTFALGQK